MSKNPVKVIGIGANGLDSLSTQSINILKSSDVIFGGKRHLEMIADFPAIKQKWISPFNENINNIKLELQDNKSIAVIATGDPSWFGVATTIINSIGADSVDTYPVAGAFSLSASHLGWALQDCSCLTVHGHNINSIITSVSNGKKILVLSQNKISPVEISNLLVKIGYPDSKINILNDLGSDNFTQKSFIANNPRTANSALNIVAIECIGTGYSLSSGLPDDAFINDGQLTKCEIRSTTISALQPYSNGILWDIGAGSGSISIEWARLGGISKAIEINSARCKNIIDNANNLGVSSLVKTHNAKLADIKDTLPVPDAIFIGGGITDSEMITMVLDSLKIGGRLVANTVTVEGKLVLYNLFKSIGGEMRRISIDRLTPIGKFNGWKSMMPVTQYIYIKDKLNV